MTLTHPMATSPRPEADEGVGHQLTAALGLLLMILALPLTLPFTVPLALLGAWG